MGQVADAPILYFDGVCNLCNGVVRFVIQHERKKKILFASLQSEAGKRALLSLQTENGVHADSIILLYNGRYYVKSSAALLCARLMGGVWQFFYIGMILPRFIRDGIYDFVARNRYRWFGKKDECMLPGPDIKARFLS